MLCRLASCLPSLFGVRPPPSAPVRERRLFPTRARRDKIAGEGSLESLPSGFERTQKRLTSLGWFRHWPNSAAILEPHTSHRGERL